MLPNDCSDSESSQVDSEDSSVEDATDDGSNSIGSCSTGGGDEHTAATTHSGSSAHDDDNDDDERLQVNIKMVGKESSESLWIDATSSVGDLKRQIANRFSVPIERQRLIFFGKLLLDNAQALGPKGACMRLGTMNYVHLSPLPDGAKPSDRPTTKMQQPPPRPPSPLVQQQHQPHEYIPRSATNRQRSGSGTMARSSIAGPPHDNTHPVPITLPVPNLSLDAQLARARRLGTQARERRRRRRRLEVSPYRYARHGLDDDDIPITPDDSFSLEHPLRHRYPHALHPPSPPPSHHYHHHPHPSHYSVRDEVLFSQLLGGPFLPPSSLSHSILAYQPVFPPPTLLSRHTEWSHPLAHLAPHQHHPLASTREMNTTTSTTGAGNPSATYTSPTTSADRLDGIRLEHGPRRRRQQQQQRQEEDELLGLRQELLQQVRRSALQLLPAVAEWHSQLERLSQWQPSSPSHSSTASSSTTTNASTAWMEDSSTTTTTTLPFALIQDTLDQMDVGIAHHWMTRLRPLLAMTLQQGDTSPSRSDSWLTMGGPRSSVSSRWLSSTSPPPPSMSSHSIPPPPPPRAARFF